MEGATVKEREGIGTQDEECIPPWHVHARVEKWNREEDYLAGLGYDDVAEAEGNLLTTVGAGRMLDLLIGAGGQVMDSAHCRIGAGDSSTAAAAGDTDLGAAAGSTHRWFQLCSSVSRATNVLTVVATFGSSDGNFAWQEWGLDFGTASGNTVATPILNHKIASLGTKASGASWTFTVTITLGP